MKIIDISWPLEATTPIKPGNEKVVFEPTKTFSKDEVREHMISIDAHTGTHIAAPASFFRDGKTIDELDLFTLSGPANVIDLTDIEDCIKEEHLQHLDIRQNDIILFKTKNSNLPDSAPFQPKFVHLDDSAADYLVKKKVKTIGFDYITLEHGKEGNPVHRQLLHNGITIIEGLRLDNAMPGVYFFFCLPIYAIGIEAAPARAVLLDVSEDIEKEYQQK